MSSDKNKGGRPALPPGAKLVVVPVRLTEAQKAKLQRIGVQRLRDWLDKAKETNMTTKQLPEWMSTLGRMAMQVEGELNRLKAKAANSNTDELQAIAELLELIEHAAGNGFDGHPDADDRVIRARAVLRNEYPHGERRDDAPDYRTAQPFHADAAHQRKRALLAG